MAIRRFVARTSFTKVDLAGDVGVHHPLQRPVNRGAADARLGAADKIEEVVGAEVPLLLQEQIEDALPLAGALASGRTQRGVVGEGTIHGELGKWVIGWVIIYITSLSSHRLTNSGAASYSTLNELPQPQVDVAFGFLMVKPPPVIVSTKSTSAPVR